METTENNLESNDSNFINEEMQGYLLETSKWAKFISIIGFIGLGLLVLASLFMIIFGRSFSSYQDGRAFPGWIGIIYLFAAILYFFPINYLYKFSKGVKEGINMNNRDSFTVGLQNLKSHYKFIGIFTIIVVSMYILFFTISMIMLAIR